MTGSRAPGLGVRMRRVLLATVAAASTVCATTKPDNLRRPDEILLLDPAGDDRGPGTYTYPSDPAFKPGSFDLRSLRVTPSHDTVELELVLGSRIEDPWSSTAWGGNGFSLQMAFIHIDVDRALGSGAIDGLPGTNVRFAPQQAWDRVVIVSPQSATRLRTEVRNKAGAAGDLIVIPKQTRARGKRLIAIVSVDDLGGVPTRSWGYQVLMQSNDSSPDLTDFLTRDVIERADRNHFGGGSDFDDDPHIIDIFVGAALGLDEERQQQYERLRAYRRDGADAAPEGRAVVPMIYLDP